MRLVDVVRLAAAQPARSGTDLAAIEITGVSLDSRRVAPGDLYAALPGSHAHGAQFTASAAAGGARAVLTDLAGAQEIDVDRVALPVLITDDPRVVLGPVSAAVFGHPAARLATAAVTGTNGKTTTTHLIEGALSALGHRAGLVGTVATRVAGADLPSVRTTPEAPDLQRLLAEMVRRDVSTVAVEVSSHALALHRVDGMTFTVAGFTNLTHDHLDFHASMEDYFAAKASLFTPARARYGVICVDDEYGRRLADRATSPISTFSSHPALNSRPSRRATGAAWPSSAPHWHVIRSGTGPDGVTQVAVADPNGNVHDLRCLLPGEFNVANTVLAFVMLAHLGVPSRDAAMALSAVHGVPGRMQRVTVSREQCLAVVDYAHSPDAIASVLTSLRPATPGRLVIVLGAGGDRDHGKRAGMGHAAATYADVVVVTDDNPRSEDPATIRETILRGAHAAVCEGATAALREVPGRGAAISAAVAEATGPDDTLVVAGKGHEQTQELADRVEAFDDRDVLARALGLRFGRAGNAGAGQGFDQTGCKDEGQEVTGQ